jgi:hypothetical protein
VEDEGGGVPEASDGLLGTKPLIPSSSANGSKPPPPAGTLSCPFELGGER